MGGLQTGMGLRKHRHRDRLRLPDYVALALVAAMAASATLWWRARIQPAWRQTQGFVEQGEVVDSHYNAEATEPRVDIVFTYSAMGNVHKGRWTGFWPEDHSPNALPEGRYGELFEESYPLTVFYNPRNPEDAALHRRPEGQNLVLAGTTIVLTALTALYLLRTYPAWRRR